MKALLMPLALASLATAGYLVAPSAPNDAIDPTTGLPDPKVPGFQFPEADLTVNQWVYGGAFAEQVRHGWGLWTALTQESGKTIGGEPLRVFETWVSPKELIAASADGGQLMQDAPVRTAGFARPNQLQAPLPDAAGPDFGLVVDVSYNPAAARHAVSNSLFKRSTLESYLDMGYERIPDFPAESITLKPVWKIIRKSELNEQGLYVLPAWPGPPPSPQAFGQSEWNAVVYVDPNGPANGNGAIDRGMRGPTAATTYDLDDFIHFSLTDADAQHLEQRGIDPAPESGDISILVAMHVTTREIERWTWQTFWWEASPDQPAEPSNAQLAGLRPAQLQGAPRHYAMGLGYQMLEPAQPVFGGRSVGTPMPVYNPYLEAGFGPSTFQWSEPVETPTGRDTMAYGVESNCMTCHAAAQYDPQVDYTDGNNRQTPYAANYYVDLGAPAFEGSLQVDFLWSILGELELSK